LFSDYKGILAYLLDALRRHQSETVAALELLLPAVLELAFRGGAADQEGKYMLGA